MTAANKVLRDDCARRNAISVHDQSVLVEAGAGSGKTAVMAGRIAAMLAEGIAPHSIAAVTFTELAASELLFRVRDFVGELSAGKIPTELRIAFTSGLSESHKANLLSAAAAIDEITCSTIHGFCQRLIRPYPVEADIDPGARVIDSSHADLAFIEIVDTWLHEQLSRDEGGIIAELVLQNPTAAVALIHKVSSNLRKRRHVSGPASTSSEQHIRLFHQAAAALQEFSTNAPATEWETKSCGDRFAEMAKALQVGPHNETPAGLVSILVTEPHQDLCTKSGTFLVYKKKGKWIEAAKRAGLSKAEGESLFVEAEARYISCCDAWHALLQNIAARVLSDLIDQVQPLLIRFRDYKRSAALLDFDDLIFSARNLLRDHESVRRALAVRFSRVLVDEFQDTDPLQTEIFWRLCGEPPSGDDSSNWTAFVIRPGALFVVGDPKQAIYRFRGADVGAYVQARDAFKAHNPDSVLSISTNFRSCAPILKYVNERFGTLLSAVGQPGFTALDAFHSDRGKNLCVAALDVAAADESGTASVERQRDAEADAVAETCARLIGNEMILDRHSGLSRICRPGDIALLAPTGSDLWRYEEALERQGVPVATQAGKGLFRRQEIQDLIAITRVLADRRDTLALIALLRGPLVGLTEEELLDIIWSLPRSDRDQGVSARLDLRIDAAVVDHPLARSIIQKLQSLIRRANVTTPHELLSQAIDVMRVRPILLARHRGQAERALANVDLYLSLATAFSVRGLRAFAETMTTAWTDETHAVEGRPDAQEEAVALYTMHAAKGLEWPIVIPINTMTGVMAADSAVTDRVNEIFYCPVLGVKPAGYEQARDDEKAELDRERVRLWYVAATRARELLILPRLDVLPSKSTWISLVDLSLSELPSLPVDHLPTDFNTGDPSEINAQTRESFAAEAAVITNLHQHLQWLAPSRDEADTGPIMVPETLNTQTADIDAASLSNTESGSHEIQGGRERGLILHKLFEEVLTGETAGDAVALKERSLILISSMGQTATDDPAKGLSPDEIARCVMRTFALPKIAELLPRLMPEFPVYASTMVDGTEQVVAGIADAIGVDLDGRPNVVLDWKSDVDVARETLEHYRSQVRNYLEATGIDRGLIVLVTTGTVLEVTL